MYRLQVDKEHYDFDKYITKKRWISYWHQLDEVIKLKPQSVLEVGVGAGIFKALAQMFISRVETIDIDPAIESDLVACVLDLPFKDNSFDVVVGFQVLEHIGYNRFIPALDEMRRVAQHNIVLSLPDSRRVYAYSLYVPHFGGVMFHLPRPQLSSPKHKFNGEHYWEINKKGYSLKRILSDMKNAGLILKKTYRVHEFPYHRYFVIAVNKK